MTKTDIAKKLLTPFKLTFYEIRKEKLFDYEIQMIVENNKQYSEVFIKKLLDAVHNGEVKGK
jgi:hypothetical protein